MPTRLSAVEAAAIKLTPPSLHRAWEAEIARREADLAAGRSTTIPAEEVLAEIQDILDNHPDPLEAFASIVRQSESNRTSD